MTRLEVCKLLLEKVREIRMSGSTEAAAEVLPMELKLSRRVKSLEVGRRVRRAVAAKAS